ncbi:MAG TPA: hypothetical protein VFH31_05470 [Pyrinomonadaceae bacterium]|nr:hypothetical protein [Pyrinomonadaceae bacterium]
MNRDLIKLEIVKLCHRHDLEPAQIIARAKAIEDYVFGEVQEAEQPRRGRPPRNPQGTQPGN